MNKAKNVRDVGELLHYTKESGTVYAGVKFPAGYHTIKVLGETIEGQRKPEERFQQVPYDFTDKIVLDMGSNQGGMLFEIADVIKYGVGVDYDSRMINVANKIKSVEQIQNLDFYMLDFDRENLDYVKNMMTYDPPDIIMLLAVCKWVKKWREVIRFCHGYAEHLLFESNGSTIQRREQVDELKRLYGEVTLLAGESTDDAQPNRQLYLCKR